MTASRYTGVVPIRSPYTGLSGKYLEVRAPYDVKVLEVLPLVGGSLQTEWEPRLPLERDVPNNAPIIMECVRFMQEFAQAIKKPWQKFHVEEEEAREPNGGTDWNRYACESFEPVARLRFHNRNNSLTTDHPEWRQLTYVLDLCLNELSNYRARGNLGVIFSEEARGKLERYVREHQMEEVKKFRLINSDPGHITELKERANVILQRASNLRCAWRVDYAEMFERYCQYVCRKVAERSGGEMIANKKLSVEGRVGGPPAWMLRYLEPDILLKVGGRTVVIDAKYKSHMLNVGSGTLKEEFRADLHQVLGYAQLCTREDSPTIIILYPWTRLQAKDDESQEQREARERKIWRQRTVTIRGYGGRDTTLHCLGIPIDEKGVATSAEKIRELCEFE